MKKINLKILIITVIVCLLPIFGGLYYYDVLPEQIAVHFDFNGNPDNYWHKSVFIFVLPIIMAAIQILCCLSSDLCDEEREANKKAAAVFKWIIPGITCVLFATTLNYALGVNVNIGKIGALLFGVLMILSGNYIPKTKGSYVIHVQRTPNEHLNKKIAKITGYSSIIIGILSIISVFFEQFFTITAIAFLVEIVLIIAIGIRCAIEYKRAGKDSKKDKE